MSLIPVDKPERYLTAEYFTKTKVLNITFDGSIAVKVTDPQFTVVSPMPDGRQFSLLGTWKGPINDSRLTNFPLKASYSGVQAEPWVTRILKNKYIFVGVESKTKANADEIAYGASTNVKVAIDPAAPAPVPTPAPAPTPAPTPAQATTGPKAEALSALPAIKADVNTQVLPPVSATLPSGAFYVRITAPASDSITTTASRYEVEARLQDESLRIVRSGLKAGTVYWDLVWSTGTSAFVGTFMVITTRGTVEKPSAVVQPYVVTLGKAPQGGGGTQPKVNGTDPFNGPAVDLFDPNA